MVAAVIRRGDRFLVGRRPSGKRHGGLWEFPGGKVLEGESFADAVARELREELTLGLRSLGAVLHRVRDPGSPFTIHFVEASVQGEPQAIEHSELTWADRMELRRLSLAPADERFVRDRLESETGPVP